ncbi:MAG: cation:dicarboxylase symporter family transporter [Planctomycetes bacterium]|nr:cation:dicarboxylase symporter family transporter [Planctomycetota bacterium]
MDEQEWGALMARYRDHLKAEKALADLTIRNYTTDLRPLYDYMKMKGLSRLEELDRTILRAYLAWLIELGYVRSSIVRKLSALRTFLGWLVRQGVIADDPLPKRGVMKKETRLPRFLSQEEAARLVHSPDPSKKLGIRDRALLELIYGAGLRVSEARDLDVHNVNLQAKEMRVTGKGSKQRMVLIGAAARGQALPVIFFSLMLGIVITTLGDKSAILIDFFGALFEAIMKLVQLVIWMTPVGVFSLLTWTVARIGLASFGQAIGGYMITVTLGLAIHGFVVLPLVCVLFARCNPFKFMHQMRQAMMTALGTDSSSATLPVTIECATQNAGISKRSAGFVLPLGSTINMDGTALYEAVAVVFLAQAYGIELELPQLVLVAITATLAAIGAAGIPSAGLVTMVIVINAVNPGLEAMGKDTIPIAAIGLIIGVDRILDMMRTTVNVWGDAVGAKIVDAIGRR